MILKLCNRCKKPIPSYLKYCGKCQYSVEIQKEEYKAIRDSKYNKNRNPKYKEFYNSKEWRLLKEKKLEKEQYKCERCKEICINCKQGLSSKTNFDCYKCKHNRTVAMEVHHKEPIQTMEGWNLRLDYNNLEALCTDCHNFRHKRFQKRKKV